MTLTLAWTYSRAQIYWLWFLCFSKCCKRVPRVDLRRKLPPSKESVNKELLQHLEGHQSDVYAPVVRGSESTGQTNTVDTKAYDNMLLNDGKNSPTYIYIYTALLHKMYTIGDRLTCSFVEFLIGGMLAMHKFEPRQITVMFPRPRYVILSAQ